MRLRGTVYLNFANNAKWSFDALTEVWSSAFSWSSIKTTTLQRDFWMAFGQGSAKKHVPCNVEGSCGSAQCIQRQPVFGLMQSCLHSHHPSSKTFIPRFLHTKTTLLGLGISWLCRGLLRGAPRMSGSDSYSVTRIMLEIKCSTLGPWSPWLFNGSHCFALIWACQGFVVNVLFAKLE